eukprot:2315190-Rhodomonas_salina.1
MCSESEACVFRLTEHPYTNWSPVVEGICDIEKLATDPNVALKSIYAVRAQLRGHRVVVRSVCGCDV